MRLALLASFAALSLACSSSSSSSAPTTLGTPEVHRTVATDCATTTPTKTCTGDLDCQMLGTSVKCVSGSCVLDECTKDADCGATGVCSCKGATREWAGATPGNLCVQGNCRVDADCGPAGWCSPSYGDCGSFYGVQGYWCHTASDACHDDAQCSGSDGGFGAPWCGYDSVTGAWACKTGGCAG